MTKSQKTEIAAIVKTAVVEALPDHKPAFARATCSHVRRQGVFSLLKNHLQTPGTDISKNKYSE